LLSVARSCQTGESKNAKKISTTLEVKILETNMPGWNTKSWKQTCQAGKPNVGNKHARVGEPDSGVDLSVQSPLSGGPSLFYFNVQRFHWARSYTIAKMEASLGCFP